MTGAFLTIPGNLLLETAAPRPCRVVLDFRDWFVVLPPTHSLRTCLQVRRGAGNISSWYSPSRRLFPDGSLGEQISPLHPCAEKRGFQCSQWCPKMRGRKTLSRDLVSHSIPNPSSALNPPSWNSATQKERSSYRDSSFFPDFGIRLVQLRGNFPSSHPMMSLFQQGKI